MLPLRHSCRWPPMLRAGGFIRRTYNQRERLTSVPELRQRPRRGLQDGSELDDDVVVLDDHRIALGHIGALDDGRARLELDVVAAQPGAARIAPGLAGRELELPAVPGAAQELAAPLEPVI